MAADRALPYGGDEEYPLTENVWARAYSACRQRAERIPRGWRVPAVDDAVQSRVGTGDYAVLDETRAADWNDEAARLIDDVTDDLVARVGSLDVVAEYVQLAVGDWFRLPSRSAALGYLAARTRFREEFGSWRSHEPAHPAVEVFQPSNPRAAGVPRVVLHQHLDLVLVQFVAHRADGFTGRWGVVGRAGTLVPIDAGLLDGLPTGFVSSVEGVVRAFRALEQEWGSVAYQAGMRRAHDGLEPFPS